MLQCPATVMNKRPRERALHATAMRKKMRSILSQKLRAVVLYGMSDSYTRFRSDQAGHAMDAESCWAEEEGRRNLGKLLDISV